MRDETLSYSRMSRWLGCEWSYDAHYERGIRRRVTDRKLSRGRLCHAGVEAAAHYWHEHGRFVGFELADAVFGALLSELDLDEVAQLTDEQTELALEAVEICERAIKYIDFPRWEILELNGKPLIEAELRTNVPGWRDFLCYVDLVARDRETGIVWVIDYKFVERLSGFDNRDSDLQTPVYCKVLRDNGIEAQGAKLFQISVNPPSVPELTKKGAMSKAKIRTTWEVYTRALDAAGLDVADYEDMRSKLADVEFHREHVDYYPPETLERWWSEVEAVAQRMAESIGKSKCRNLRTTAMGCATCGLKDLCLTELRGDDPTFLMQTVFRHRDEPNGAPMIDLVG